jgi:dipeptidase E
MIYDAIKDGNTILSGGSAGAICWFNGGHSDSMDPATYKNAMVKATFSDES